MIAFDLGLDLFPLLAATLAAITCSLLGSFLILRKLSLMGDAISHSVLPGLVVAFLIFSSRGPLVMFAGAAVAGVATVVLVEIIKGLGRVEPGAAMGVVFSLLFALGILLIEQAAVRHVDLDADCVLHGQLETLAWYDAPLTWSGLWSTDTLSAIPRQVSTLALAAAGAILLVTVLFKELRLAAFDPALATTQGFHAGLLHYILMIAVAAATVASFEAVGSILVIAMLICPAASARMLTDRMPTQLWLSALIAALTAVGGYLSATALPAAFGVDSLNAAGMITVTSGVVLTAVVIASPSHGLVAKKLRLRALQRRMIIDDLLAEVFRSHEQTGRWPTYAALDHPRITDAALNIARKQQLINATEDSVELTKPGHTRAAEIIRRHRLWEDYLVRKVGLPADHVHETAEQLEHFPPLPTEGPTRDPHGKPIPPSASQ